MTRVSFGVFSGHWRSLGFLLVSLGFYGVRLGIRRIPLGTQECIWDINESPGVLRVLFFFISRVSLRFLRVPWGSIEFLGAKRRVVFLATALAFIKPMDQQTSKFDKHISSDTCLRNIKKNFVKISLFGRVITLIGHEAKVDIRLLTVKNID